MKRVELEQKLADEIQNRDYLIDFQVKLREKKSNAGMFSSSFFSIILFFFLKKRNVH